VRVSGGDPIYKAPLFHECIIGECRVVTSEGNERRSMMQLNLTGADGTWLQRPDNEGPFYQCERPGCYYHDHPRGLHELNTGWIRDAHRIEPKRQTGDELTEKDKEVWI